MSGNGTIAVRATAFRKALADALLFAGGKGEPEGVRVVKLSVESEGVAHFDSTDRFIMAKRRVGVSHPEGFTEFHFHFSVEDAKRLVNEIRAAKPVVSELLKITVSDGRVLVESPLITRVTFEDNRQGNVVKFDSLWASFARGEVGAIGIDPGNLAKLSKVQLDDGHPRGPRAMRFEFSGDSKPVRATSIEQVDGSPTLQVLIMPHRLES